MNFSALTEKIEQYDIITVFRHEHPDCDAYGSQFAMCRWIRDNWPEKKVYALGMETCSQGRFPALDQADDATVEKSLAIVLDTANTPRIDDTRALNASCLVKVDHHPDLDHYGDLSFVNPHAAAACEILTGYFRSETEKKMSRETAEYLYQGLLTDTLSFSTSNTTRDTLEAAGWLASYGINIPELNRVLFDRTLKEFRFAGYICANVRMADAHTAYVLLTEEDLAEWGMSASEARTYVTELGHVVDFEKWAIITETSKGVYAVSARSKTAAINTLAAEFGGGGHKNAAGIKNLTENSVKKLIDKLVDCH